MGAHLVAPRRRTLAGTGVRRCERPHLPAPVAQWERVPGGRAQPERALKRATEMAQVLEPRAVAGFADTPPGIEQLGSRREPTLDHVLMRRRAEVAAEAASELRAREADIASA